MSAPRAFIPKDKPKSWVVYMLASLIGLAIGLVGFAAAWAGISWLKSLAMFLFILCWLVAAASWLVLIFGSLTGRYRNMQLKEWREQIMVIEEPNMTLNLAPFGRRAALKRRRLALR